MTNPDPATAKIIEALGASIGYNFRSSLSNDEIAALVVADLAECGYKIAAFDASGERLKEEGVVKLSDLVSSKLQEPTLAILPDGNAVCMGGRWRGWMFRKHPDGQWISMLKLTEESPF